METQNAQSGEHQGQLAHLAGKYLTFRVDDEEYGVQINKVREIIGVLDVTPVPQTADHVLGVINLRGKVIPVIDLRLKFGMAYRQPDDRTCIVVVEVLGEMGVTLLMGVVVDAVREVINVAAADLEPAPTFGVELDMSYLLGMAKVDGKVKTILDIDKVLGDRHAVL
ncbi:CheW protein [Desulfarculus baarsii DSM 2075]|uniref:CheW protein n=1 Tax=Desulfarculus baarsii (strain ATCC 33931 / DSM 2075 / LMG 7858 / VKM B-1802 / 2st14) TaxID=644282 RepID=E1QM92_DESB2|nr:chemotaxis protein CheW [Desulfarculus baarsii]ADK86135.1 CheW protein [Desulfarculus baarsii DSM 2075]